MASAQCMQPERMQVRRPGTGQRAGTCRPSARSFRRCTSRRLDSLIQPSSTASAASGNASRNATTNTAPSAYSRERAERPLSACRSVPASTRQSVVAGSGQPIHHHPKPPPRAVCTTRAASRNGPPAPTIGARTRTRRDCSARQAVERGRAGAAVGRSAGTRSSTSRGTTRNTTTAPPMRSGADFGRLPTVTERRPSTSRNSTKLNISAPPGR